LLMALVLVWWLLSRHGVWRAEKSRPWLLPVFVTVGILVYVGLPKVDASLVTVATGGRHAINDDLYLFAECIGEELLNSKALSDLATPVRPLTAAELERLRQAVFQYLRSPSLQSYGRTRALTNYF